MQRILVNFTLLLAISAQRLYVINHVITQRLLFKAGPTHICPNAYHSIKNLFTPHLVEGNSFRLNEHSLP